MNLYCFWCPNYSFLLCFINIYMLIYINKYIYIFDIRKIFFKIKTKPGGLALSSLLDDSWNQYDILLFVFVKEQKGHIFYVMQSILSYRATPTGWNVRTDVLDKKRFTKHRMVTKMMVSNLLDQISCSVSTIKNKEKKKKKEQREGKSSKYPRCVRASEGNIK